jgi:NAD(P)-dependent dehydrogenase (short-subunit alcohol dehydrogenase family)
MSDKKTAIVTGAQQGIGAGLVEGFLARTQDDLIGLHGKDHLI